MKSIKNPPTQTPKFQGADLGKEGHREGLKKMSEKE